MSSTSPLEEHPTAAGKPDAAPRADEGVPFGRYRLLGALGEGGMGTVHRAWDPALGRRVALKRLHAAGQAGPDERARFLREARLAARLRHPGIVTVFDVEEIEGCLAIAMELVEGPSLDDWLAGPEGRGPSALGRGIELLWETAVAVAHAHREGVVHRDLKPLNVLLGHEGRARVADFGMAKEVRLERSGDGHGDSPPLTGSGQTLGTPAYMSPEQAVGDTGRVGPRSDVWALGIILYQLLAGRTPFERATPWETMRAVATEVPPPPSACASGVPAGLEAVCLRALEREPSRRYADAGELAEELRRWRAGEPLHARPAGLGGRLADRLRRRGRTLGWVAAFALALATVLAWGVAGARYRMAQSAQAEVAAAVRDLEDRIRGTAMPPEARRELARQPLARLDDWIEQGPDGGVGHAWRGRVRALLGDGRGAEEDFDLACARSPGRAEPWWQRGLWRMENYLQRRGLPEMRVEAGRAVAAPPRPETAEESAQRAAALDDLGRLAALSGGIPAVHEETARLARGLAALARGDDAGNEEAVSLVAGLDLPKAHKIRARALYQSGRLDEAIEAYSRVLARWREDADAWRSRGLARHLAALLARGRGVDVRAPLAEAEEDFREAIAREPDDARCRFGRAHVLLDRARALAAQGEDGAACLQGAEEELEAALRLGHAAGRVHRARGCVHLEAATLEHRHGRTARTRFERAIAEFGAAAGANPDPGHDFLQRARAHAALAMEETLARQDSRGSYERALADLDRAIGIQPDDPEPLVERGSVHFTMALVAVVQGRDPRSSLEQSLRDLESARGLPSGAPLAARPHARARSLRARLDAGGPADARAELRAALAELDAVLAGTGSDEELLVERAQLGGMLGDLEAAFGADARSAWRAAVADLDLLLAAARRQAGSMLVARGNLYWRLALAEWVRGESLAEDCERAVADFAAARDRHGVDTAVSLGYLHRTRGRFVEAGREFARFAESMPDGHPLGRRLVEECRLQQSAGEAAWALAWGRGDRALWAVDYTRARAEYEAASLGLRGALHALSSAEGGEGRRASELRTALAATCLGLARAEAGRAQGRGGASAPEWAPDPATREGCVDRMFEHLGEAAANGIEAAIWAGEPGFAPYLEDPRARRLRGR